MRVTFFHPTGNAGCFSREHQKRGATFAKNVPKYVITTTKFSTDIDENERVSWSVTDASEMGPKMANITILQKPGKQVFVFENVKKNLQ